MCCRLSKECVCLHRINEASSVPVEETMRLGLVRFAVANAGE